MHILLTDILTCPRCGPAFGLIVLADSIVERRVRQGRLGCANCRATYPVTVGLADLTHPEVEPLEIGTGVALDDERVFRIAALIGARPPGGRVLVVSRERGVAERVAGVLGEVEVAGGVAVADDPPDEAASSPHGGLLGEVVHGRRLPYRSGAFRAVAVVGGVAREPLEEARRILLPGARLVVDGAGADTAGTLREIGFTVDLEQDGTVVAAAPGPR